jgi:thiol-disulfide isomerase/thioredoxin
MSTFSSDQVPLGWQAAPFNLPATDGKNYSLESFNDKKGVCVVFTCNHCPYAQATWPQIINLASKYSNVAFVAINPNDAVEYPDDSFEEMKKRVQDWGIPFPYLRDESQQTAKVYNALCTPDPFLFKNINGELKLFYHGRVNDNWKNPQLVTERNLENAIVSLLSGGNAPSEQPPSMGCSIKWKDNSDS